MGRDVLEASRSLEMFHRLSTAHQVILCCVSSSDVWLNLRRVDDAPAYQTSTKLSNAWPIYWWLINFLDPFLGVDLYCHFLRDGEPNDTTPGLDIRQLLASPKLYWISCILLHFETGATQRGLPWKIDAKFRTFHSMWKLSSVGEISESVFQVTFRTQAQPLVDCTFDGKRLRSLNEMNESAVI